MSIAPRYNPEQIEQKWYEHWEKRGYFHSVPDERQPFSIVIPPPNVTGKLHMGHMLNNTVQDILCRKARLDGYNVCWVPGTDHASIATEAKVVRMLRERGIKKADLTREQFIEYAWEWTHKYGGIILKQLRRLGASCDWERVAFTMDQDRSESVIQAFIDLYRNGKLYRDYRMVNWDPEGKTVLSNEEVLYSEETTKLCYVRYRVVGNEEDFVTVATTRPETILGDTAVAVHPEDERYRHLQGKKVLVPVVGREVPVIFDEYVDRAFGTGALKVTPAHDANDYDIGKRHDLEVIDVLNPDGTISEAGCHYIGETREEARKLIIQAMEAEGLIEKIEDYTHSVGRSERTHAIVEPRLSLQWYVDMKALAAPALEAVMNDEVDFIPKRQKNIYRHWMENIRDWCISRQLWWGHRIPAYYFGEDVYVARTREEALNQARIQHGDHLTIDDLRQDEDVLDTWFSSWLWPITCFHGFQYEEELKYYYPTSVLVTGWDIIFLWVARMIMSGYEWRGEKPFNQVYFTGMVRDKQRRKMSKSLGNSPDALSLIDTYGADGVRFGVMSSSPAGGDLLFDEKLCEQGRNFCNKIWNALRLVKGWEVDPAKVPDPGSETAHRWITAKFSQLLGELEEDYKAYRLSDVTMKLYSFIWNDFCSWYLEMIKPSYGEAIDSGTLEKTIDLFGDIMTCLHPLMPFITEEIWHHLRERRSGDDCMLSSFPQFEESDVHLIADMERLEAVIVKTREIRNEKNLKPKELLNLYAEGEESILSKSHLTPILSKLAYIGEIHTHSDFPSNGSIFMAANEKMFLQYSLDIDPEEERQRVQKELDYAEGFLQAVRKKLSNERFVQNAPTAVVEKERQKLKDGEERVRILRENLESL